MTPLRQFARLAAALALSAGSLQAIPQVESTATAPLQNFESGPVRQLMVSGDGQHLYLLNPLDNRLEIFAISEATDSGGNLIPELSYEDSIFTGLEPVAMAVHPQDPNRLFVANLVSDSVAVVDLTSRTVETVIQVGDEPRDLEIVGDKLFVASSRVRDFANPSNWIDHAVTIHDASPPYAPRKAIDIRGHKPRSLCSDGQYVYVVPQNSGNKTTLLKDDWALSLGIGPLKMDQFDTNFVLNKTLTNTPAFGERGWRMPQVARIVFDNEYPFWTPRLKDRDIRAIAVNTERLARSATKGVGTTLFAIEQNPVTGNLWVANTDANNRTRMEYNLKGSSVKNQITVVETGPGGDVTTKIELAAPSFPQSYSQPHAIEFHNGSAGQFAYVAALGNAAVLVLDANSGSFVQELPTASMPGGLAVDPVREWLFVYSRGDKTISSYSIANNHAKHVDVTPLPYDPEPEITATGRRLLYEARSSSGAANNAMSCASCHVFGDTDQLAWDLGNSMGGLSYAFPGTMGQPNSGFEDRVLTGVGTPLQNPMKGPMFTQSLRGLKNGEPFHWRGDRPFFHNFQGAFTGLNGGTGVSKAEMQQFATFIDTVTFPPNPYQRKDRQYVGDQLQAIKDFGMPPYQGVDYATTGEGFTCNSCHAADLIGGTDYSGATPWIVEESLFQVFNPVTLRGVYEKQYRELTGFGTHHDGVTDGVFGFLDMKFLGIDGFDLLSKDQRHWLADMVHAWDTGLAPLIGHQGMLNASIHPETIAFLRLAMEQAKPAKAWLDLIGHGWMESAAGTPTRVGMHFTPNPSTGQWELQLDDGTWMPPMSLYQLALNGKANIQFTAVAYGTGSRLGTDRDEDGLLNGLELVHGTLGHDPDTDDDGYADGTEIALGGNPTSPDAMLTDSTPPVVEAHEAIQTFVTTSTIQAQTDEATQVSVLVHLPGGGAIGPFSSTGLRRKHQVLLEGLPPGTTMQYEVHASDRNGNPTVASGSLTTVINHFHVDSISLNKIQSNPVVLEAKFSVVDINGTPVAGVPVRGRLSGDIGANDGTFWAETDPNGIATYTLNAYTSSSYDTVYVGLDFLGSRDDNHPYFVGYGAGTASFFYDQPANVMNYATVQVP